MQAPQGHIIAMGGGGFSMEPDNPLLDDYVLSLCAHKPPRVCFVPTASGDSAAYLARFYRAFAGRCSATDLTLADGDVPRRPARTSDLADFVARQDIFYVGGGSTLHLLALWRAHGLDRLLHDAWRAGATLCGVSAGMNCWFAASITDSFGGLEPLHQGLGLIESSACPHYDGEPMRRAAFHAAVKAGMPAGYAADDGAALHFAGHELVAVVSSRANAHGYKVELRGDEVVEEVLPTRFLGAPQAP